MLQDSRFDNVRARTRRTTDQLARETYAKAWPHVAAIIHKVEHRVLREWIKNPNRQGQKEHLETADQDCKLGCVATFCERELVSTHHSPSPWGRPAEATDREGPMVEGGEVAPPATARSEHRDQGEATAEGNDRLQDKAHGGIWLAIDLHRALHLEKADQYGKRSEPADETAGTADRPPLQWGKPATSEGHWRGEVHRRAASSKGQRGGMRGHFAPVGDGITGCQKSGLYSTTPGAKTFEAPRRLQLGDPEAGGSLSLQARALGVPPTLKRGAMPCEGPCSVETLKRGALPCGAFLFWPLAGASPPVAGARRCRRGGASAALPALLLAARALSEAAGRDWRSDEDFLGGLGADALGRTVADYASAPAAPQAVPSPLAAGPRGGGWSPAAYGRAGPGARCDVAVLEAPVDPNELVEHVLRSQPVLMRGEAAAYKFRKRFRKERLSLRGTAAGASRSARCPTALSSAWRAMSR
ncbi:unnamed protein product [Prorocentrum cordatum]|uniref:Uncharacterized protein n=1 Tax=Prorocentrum cordatum TaxID=2364126 RepID=A0ABN9URA6_9DINO|nr:unnamed protein product [Polarella glacialis]